MVHISADKSDINSILIDPASLARPALQCLVPTNELVRDVVGAGFRLIQMEATSVVALPSRLLEPNAALPRAVCDRLLLLGAPSLQVSPARNLWAAINLL